MVLETCHDSVAKEIKLSSTSLWYFHHFEPIMKNVTECITDSHHIITHIQSG